MGDPGPRADATDVEPDAQPARRGHRRVRRQVDVLGDCRPREPVHAAARRHGGPANAPRLKGALCAGRRHWGPRRAPAPVDRVVSLSPNCGTAAGTVSRSRTTRPATLTVTVPRPDPDPPAPAPGVESDDEGLGADGAEAPAAVGGGSALDLVGQPAPQLVWTRTSDRLAKSCGTVRSGEVHMPDQYFQGTPGAAAQRLRRQVDALSDCRGPHVFDAEDVRLVLEYLEANEGARLAEHEAYDRLYEETATG